MKFYTLNPDGTRREIHGIKEMIEIPEAEPLTPMFYPEQSAEFKIVLEETSEELMDIISPPEEIQELDLTFEVINQKARIHKKKRIDKKWKKQGKGRHDRVTLRGKYKINQEEASPLCEIELEAKK